MDTTELMRLLPERRPGQRLRPRFRGHYEKRPARSREELVHYIKTHGVRTARALTTVREPGEPSVHDVRKAFGSWKAAKQTVWGVEQPFAPQKPNLLYLVNTVLMFNLWRRDDWASAHRRQPGIIPSPYWIRRLLPGGGFRDLVWVAGRASLKHCLEQYSLLHDRLGRHPNPEELRKYGVDLTAVKVIYRTKRELREFLEDLMNEKKKF